MSGTDDTTRDGIAAAIAENKLTRSEIAAKFGVGRGTVYRISKRMGTVAKKNGIDDAVRAARASEQARNAQAQYSAAILRIRDLEDELTAIRQYESIAERCVPMGFDVRPGATKHEAVPMLLWSDWHIDEVVDAEAMGGLNECSPAIAEERMQTLIKCTTNILRIYQGNSDIRTTVIALIGDMLTAWIHEDSLSSNSMTPPEGIVTVFNMLIGAIDTLLREFPDMHFIVVEAPGNHGRITKRLPSKKTPQKNLEWILFQLLAQHYANEARIKFRPPAGDQNWLTIMGRPVRFTHGTQIRYLGGIGGPTVSLLRALRAWDTGSPAAFTVLGHLHTPLTDMRKYAMNGSLIGYNSFARDFVKAEYSLASQVVFLMHQRYGPTGFYNVTVQKPREA